LEVAVNREEFLKLQGTIGIPVISKKEGGGWGKILYMNKQK
jgi:hypothetical protein